MRDSSDDRIDRLQSVGTDGDRSGDGGPGLLVRAVGILGVAYVAGMLGWGLIGRGPAATVSTDRFVEVVLGSAAGHALAAGGVFLVEDVEGELGHREIPAIRTLLLGAIGPGLALGGVAVLIVATTVDGGTAVGPIVGPGAEENAPGILLALIPLSIFAVAPAEELFFRGLAQRYFAGATDVRWAIVTASVLFTLLHVPQYLGLGSAGASLLLLGLIFLVGAGAGYVYERTGALVAPIALHATYNCVIAGAWYLELEYGVLPV